MSISQRRSSFTKNFTFPADGSCVYEKNPCFIFQPDKNASFHKYYIYDASGNLFAQGNTDKHYFRASKLLSHGSYSWKIESSNNDSSEIMHFTVDENAIECDIPSSSEIICGIPSEHPRHLFSKSDIPALLYERKTELEVIKRNAEIYLV